MCTIERPEPDTLCYRVTVSLSHYTSTTGRLLPHHVAQKETSNRKVQSVSQNFIFVISFFDVILKIKYRKYAHKVEQNTKQTENCMKRNATMAAKTMDLYN